jgi:uncharacterized protein YjbI with pentapeptide repeats
MDHPSGGRLVGVFIVNLFIIIAGGAALITYRSGALGASQAAARDEFTSVYTNLGSENLFERLGSLQQIPDVMLRRSPQLTGNEWLYTDSEFKQVYFHRAKRALVNYLQTWAQDPTILSKPNSSLMTQSEFDSIVETFSRIGQNGWMYGNPSTNPTSKALALNWVWSLDPRKGSLDDELQQSLAKLPFKALNLEDVGFRKANLDAPDFSGSTLDSTDFSGSQLKTPIFSNSSLIGTTFDDAHLSGARFFESDMSSARFLHANIDGAQIKNCYGSRTSFGCGPRLNNLGSSISSTGTFFARQITATNWSTSDSDFSNAQLSDWRVDASSFSECDFTDSRWSDSALTNCRIISCYFDSSSFHRTHFYACQLRKCSFQNSYLENVAMKNVDISGCDFSGTVFENVTFEAINGLSDEVIFKGAKFRNVTGLTPADIALLKQQGAIFE